MIQIITGNPCLSCGVEAHWARMLTAQKIPYKRILIKSYSDKRLDGAPYLTDGVHRTRVLGEAVKWLRSRPKNSEKNSGNNGAET